ncbi:unnamed protein product [Alopecurus aequalis]
MDMAGFVENVVSPLMAVVSPAITAVGGVAKVVNVALQINEQVATVHQNKEDCKKLATRVDRLRAIVERLDDTFVSSEQTMIDALSELEETLHRALELVKACQTRNCIWFAIKAGNVSKQLREVKDEIMEHMHIANFSNNLRHWQTIMITRVYIQNPAAVSQGKLFPELVLVRRDARTPRLSRRDNEISNGCTVDIAEELENADDSHSTNVAGSKIHGKENIFSAGSLTDTVSGFRNFSLSELKAFTDNFSDEHKIGEGGFAVVYKGELSNGAQVAIKRFHFIYDIGNFEPVVRYVEAFSLIGKHENVIRFLGYCHEIKIEVASHGDRYVGAEVSTIIVVEEYMPNGNLQHVINVLDWSSAFRIIRGIAKGVAHMHTKGIAHMDLKPANILLDSEMNPKICDFELSKILKQDHEYVTEKIVGTVGYLPPEYIGDGIVSFKHDVFSFGMLLLHTISKPGLLLDSISWLWDALDLGNLDGLLDPSSRDQYELIEVKRCMDIGQQCVATKRTDRPTMWEVVEMLDGKQQPRKIPVRSKTSSFKKKGIA